MALIPGCMALALVVLLPFDGLRRRDLDELSVAATAAGVGARVNLA
jgi:hypothetical protein